MVSQQEVEEERLKLETHAKIVLAGRMRPDLWIEKAFGCSLWEKQGEIARSVFRHLRVAVRSCEGSGKSYIAGRIGLAFLYNYAPSTVITTAPTARQVEEILWREIHGAFNLRQMPEIRGALTRKRLDIPCKTKDHFAIGLSTDEPERFQGLHNENVLVIGDEADGLSEEIYQAMENPMSTGNAHMLLIGNPRHPVGPFRRTFESNIYHTIHISAFDTPNFTQFGIVIEDIRDGGWKRKMELSDVQLKEEGWRQKLPYPSLVSPPRVAERLEEWGEASFAFQTYIMGEFPEAGEQNLFKITDIEAAVGRDIVAEGDLVAGLDIARYGDGETAFVRKAGNKVLGIDAWSKADISFTSGRVMYLCRLYGYPSVINIDATAIGQDDARIIGGEGINVNEVLVGSPAVDTERFANRRAELYWLLSKKFERGEISIPNDRRLIGQLADIRYSYTVPRGKLIMESKEQMRARGSKSPDRADALVLAFIPGMKRGKPKRRQY